MAAVHTSAFAATLVLGEPAMPAAYFGGQLSELPRAEHSCAGSTSRLPSSIPCGSRMPVRSLVNFDQSRANTRPSPCRGYDVTESLQFNMDSVDDATLAGIADYSLDESAAAVISNMQLVPSSASDLEKKLLKDVQRFKSQCLEEENRYDNIVLASKLSEVGYSVHVREALGGGTDCLRNLRHTFLFVRPDGASHTELLVEPHMREHFQIASPTRRYQAILEALPAEFVGDKSSLSALVRLACDEMAKAFQASGQFLPPWRQAKSLLSKWFPAQVRDTEMFPRHGSCSASSPPEVQSPRPAQSDAPRQQVDTFDWVPFQYGRGLGLPA